MSGSTVTHEGHMSGSGLRFAIVASRFNDLIVERLVAGATDALRRHGVDESIHVIWVPGAWELPVVVQEVARSTSFDAVIALGAVIRGATAHFEFVAGNCASALSGIALATSVPVSFGVLTTETIEQAIERAGTKAGNKGAEAALAALETASLLRSLRLGPSPWQ